MADFPYSSAVIHDWVQTPKIALAAKLVWKSRGANGLETRVVLQTKSSGTPAFMEWIVRAGLTNDYTTYSAAFLVDHMKVRGIDYHPIPRSYFYRQIVPVGWHEDILDPVAQSTRREPLALEAVTDLQDFSRKVAMLWNIQLPEPPFLL